MNRKSLPAASAIALAALLGLSTGAFAANDLSYTYIEGSYLDIDVDDADADGDGFGIAGSVALTELFHVFGSFASAELDGPMGFDVDFDTFEFGAGVNYPLGNNLDAVGRLSYLNLEVDVPGFGNADDDGYGLYGGLRGRLTAPVELEGGISFADLDEGGDDTSFVLAGRYYFTDQWAAGLSADIGDDVTVWGLNVRWEMPK
jgi:hypothetical protein